MKPKTRRGRGAQQPSQRRQRRPLSHPCSVLNAPILFAGRAYRRRICIAFGYGILRVSLSGPRTHGPRGPSFLRSFNPAPRTCGKSVRAQVGIGGFHLILASSQSSLADRDSHRDRTLTYDGVGIFGLALWMALVSPHRAAAITQDEAALSQPGKILIADAREQPDSVREALSSEFAATASASSDRQRLVHLRRARLLANAYAHAWADSFFVRQVSRFASSGPAQRAERVAVDSLRRTGNIAMGNEGVPT